MRHAIAVWNFQQPEMPTCKLIEQFADMGFDTISLLPRQLLADGGAARQIAALLRARSLGATVHGKFDLTAADIQRLVGLLGETLLCLTFDAAMASDSRGRFFDTAKMASLLWAVERCSRGGNVRFGVEDFPLDQQALDYYRGDLAGLPAIRHPD